MRQFFLFSIIALSVLLHSCKQDSKRAFYYWKTVFRLSLFEKKYLDDLKVEKLYIRFFDVTWDEATLKALPLAEIQFEQKPDSAKEIVPVIYIVNKTLIHTTDLPKLTSHILNQTDMICHTNKITFREMQIDCDWTDKTKNQYFALLNLLKTALRKRGIKISATIRLHQIKYKKITGIPDVDSGMLMYYNMGKISPDSVTNSIFSPADAEKYTEHLSAYPLPLDVALPAFSWGIHIRNERVIELLNNLDASDFQDQAYFQNQGKHTVVATHSFFYKGFYFMKNDLVKIEEISPQMCAAAANQLAGKLSGKSRTIAIYHTDSLIFKRYEKQDFEKVFSALH